MAGYASGDHDYSDDEFDLLPLGELADLEEKAIQFTQAAATTQAEPRSKIIAPSSDYGDDFDDEDFDDAVVIDESRSTPAVLPAQIRNPPALAEREPYRQTAIPYAESRSKPNVPLFQPGRANLSRNPPIPSSNSIPLRTGSQQDPVSIRDADLRQELEELRRRNQSLEQTLNAKAGEVAIVRSKQEKEAKEHERELNSLRKLNEERLAKQRKELEAARIAANNAATERDFVKQDLAESERVRRLNRTTERKDLTTTPKKKKTLPHRDGFDDDEIEIISPSKLSPSKFRSRNATPSKGKRKRKSVESPTPGLDLVQNDEPIQEFVPEPALIFDDTILARLEIQDDRFDFLGTMLDHRPRKDHIRTIEALGNYFLPSTPKESLASVILGRIPSLGLKKPTTELPIEFCHLLIFLWVKCFEEKYYQPMYLFIDMLTMALELKTISIAPQVIDTLIPAVHQMTEKILTARFYRIEEKYPMDGLDKYIDVTAYLSLLYLTALGCMSELEHITRFWRIMPIGIVLACLSRQQPTADLSLMLKLLSTSTLRDSFGPVVADERQKQDMYAVWIIDRISYPFSEIPYQAGETQRMEPHVILQMRLDILSLLMSMTRSPFASEALALHHNFIPRLITLMNDELDLLYDWRAGHELSARIVTLATRLLYHLVTKYEHLINMQQKNAQTPGGSQKYTLALSRLNFAEDDLLLESGIGPDVQGLALEMLDMSVTPEEGDEISGAYLAP